MKELHQVRDVLFGMDAAAGEHGGHERDAAGPPRDQVRHRVLDGRRAEFIIRRGHFLPSQHPAQVRGDVLQAGLVRVRPRGARPFPHLAVEFRLPGAHGGAPPHLPLALKLFELFDHGPGSIGSCASMSDQENGFALFHETSSPAT
ncbi:MAG: hypothetical protein A2902_01775 [Elusimicrobia bacterium RIFCSPLOWO2_01_FULL_64_13]|nr:MAG: hypothetical protein A2902_01775 [Elusimicrobia bacterium RIFCSPLOWO2_01_FULL_64_13]